jgi:2-oxoglutarate ferredoxin oxidoreductase subunit gamma
MSRREILLAGAGGQGVLFLGNILSLAAVKKGKRVATTPSYGVAVRGGEVKCGVIISDEAIYDPVVDEADIVVALDEASLKTFGPQVKEGGILICGESEEISSIVHSFKKKFQLISTPLHDLGSERYHNMIAMGIFLQIDSNLNIDLVKEALIKEIKKRGRESLIEENLKAIQAGMNWYLNEKGREKR